MAKTSHTGRNFASTGIASLGCDIAQTMEAICFRVGNNMPFTLMKYPCADCKSTVYYH